MSRMSHLITDKTAKLPGDLKTRPHKYHAARTQVDDIWFDSKAEAERYSELKLLEQAGKISNLRLQPRFELVPAYTDPVGQKIRAVTYVADFTYVENEKEIVEDVKGVETQVFKVKRKLFVKLYPNLMLRILKV